MPNAHCEFRPDGTETIHFNMSRDGVTYDVELGATYRVDGNILFEHVNQITFHAPAGADNRTQTVARMATGKARSSLKSLWIKGTIQWMGTKEFIVKEAKPGYSAPIIYRKM